ncbi:hypothetical protein ACJMK2_024912, partial [Sinanodonta woodiana]
MYKHGDNATLLIEKRPTDGNKSLEIIFSGFTTKQHDIHIIIIESKANNEDAIQVSRHYSGRIKDITINNESRILFGQVSKPIILPFMCNNTNTSSIKIGKNHAFDHANYIVYDVAQNRCTHTSFVKDYNDRIESCVVNEANFDIAFRELIWTDKGAYTAWDDQGLLLDSVFVSITEKTLWHMVPSLLVILVATFLAVVTVMKLRQNKVSNSTINNLTDRNGNPNTADISRNRHFEETTSPEESEMSLTNIDNADDQTDLTGNESNENVKSTDKRYSARGLNLNHNTTPTSKFQVHFKNTHEYSSTQKCPKLKTECLSGKPHISATQSIEGPSFEYDYVVQGSWKTSRARAPYPVVIKQNERRVITDDSISWHVKEDKMSSSGVDPSTSYASVNKTRTRTHCTDSSAEQGSCDLNIELE